MSLETDLAVHFPDAELARERPWSGAPEAVVIVPRTLEACAEVLVEAGARGRRVVVRGGGSLDDTYARQPSAPDLVLSTRALYGVTAYEPEDGTLTALAGTPMAELEAAVSEGGHHLSPEVATPGRATLGGVVGGGRSGFDRLRYGALRENVLGMRVALPSGKVVRSGGNLVKNVTGYDLHRLFCGSHGTLGVIGEVSLRLYPRPEALLLLRTRFTDRAHALREAAELATLPVTPLAVTVSDLDDAEGYELEVYLAGRTDVLAWEADRIGERLRAPHALEGDAARVCREEARDAERGAALRFQCRPSRAAEVVARIAELAAEAAPRFHVHPRLAEGTVRFAEGADLRSVARTLAKAGLPATLRWPCVPPDARADVPSTTEPSPEAEAWMRKLRASFDPQGCLPHERLFA